MMLGYNLQVFKLGLILNRRKLNNTLGFKRNIQISVVGAAGKVGSNLALLLKQNSKVDRLQLYDDDVILGGIGMELSLIPGGPIVSAFSGNSNLAPSLCGSDIIVMTTRISRKPGNTREQMMNVNAQAVQSVCKAMVDVNQNAFLAISTNPINCIIPFAGAVLYKYKCYNPYKVFGITHIDTARSRSLAAKALEVNAKDLHIPVIGGHSDDTIIPLFSNLSPSRYNLDPRHADTLTRMVRKSGNEVVCLKKGKESSTTAMAWSINEFVEGLIDAIRGSEVVLCCYTANSNFGTRFFAGPTVINGYGISYPCSNFVLSDYESTLLQLAIPKINRDVSSGEDYVRYIEELGK